VGGGPLEQLQILRLYFTFFFQPGYLRLLCNTGQMGVGWVGGWVGAKGGGCDKGLPAYACETEALSGTE